MLSSVMNSIKRGALIVVEGVDRSGKSTQCRQLVAALQQQKIPAELMGFPDRSTLTGQLIDQYLKNTGCRLNDKAIHLLFTANRWENVDKMKELIHSGVTLVIDRYAYSGIVFSAIKKHMDMNWCAQPENGLPKPDIVFLLTLDEENMLNRPGFGDERYENVATQRLVADMYRKLSKSDDNWQIIDAGRSVEAVHEDLLAASLEKLDKVKNHELGQLKFDFSNLVHLNGSLNGSNKT